MPFTQRCIEAGDRLRSTLTRGSAALAGRYTSSAVSVGLQHLPPSVITVVICGIFPHLWSSAAGFWKTSAASAATSAGICGIFQRLRSFVASTSKPAEDTLH
jgi:hypothetical protein